MGEERPDSDLTTTRAGSGSGRDAHSEERVLALLEQSNLQASDFEQIVRDPLAVMSRKVKVAVVNHARAPRHVTLPLLRHLFTFDLMRVALTATAAGDIKNAADEILISKLDSVPTGERLALARRASGKVARALLLDNDHRVTAAALNNPRLTQTLVIKALQSAGGNPSLVSAVASHPKWGLQPDVRLALLGCEGIAFDGALVIARSLPSSAVAEVLRVSKLPWTAKRRICAELNIQQPD